MDCSFFITSSNTSFREINASPWKPLLVSWFLSGTVESVTGIFPGLLVVELLVLFHFIVQGLPVYIQELRRLALIEIDLFQSLEDHFIFGVYTCTLEGCF